MTDGVIRGPHGALLEARDSVPVFKLGTQLEFSDGDMFQYVEFAGALDDAKVYVITPDFEVGGGVTTALAASAPHACGVLATEVTAAGYGWIQRQGTFPAVEYATGMDPDVALYTTATAGRLDDAVTAGLVQSLKNIGVATTGAGDLRESFSALPLQIVTGETVVN